MIFGSTFRRYWPWWVAFAWLLAYEAYALISGTATLSRMVWRAQVQWLGLVWVVLGIVGVLLAHFFIRKRKT
jgi:hypothetical protein